MTFSVEVVLKGRDFATTEAITLPGEAASWDDAAVREALIEILRAIERAENPGASRDRAVVLRGFSWIVEPMDGQVVLAIEIPMGAAVAGPFAVEQATFDASIDRVLKAERALTSPGGQVH